MEFRRLFEPIRIGKVSVRNRVAMAPLVTGYSDRGYVSEQHLSHYAARARGGTGLIITEHTLASKWAEDNCPLDVLRLYDVSHLPGFSDLADTIHAFGARAFIQLNVGVGVQGSSLRTGVQPVGPSTVGFRAKPELDAKNLSSDLVGETPREMTVEEIEREQDNFAKAAVLARAAGFDGVEIHAAHGFLLHGFLSPRFNRRTDRYGGSLENRMRFLVEILRKTKAAVGNEMAVGVRASAHEPEGTTYEDMKIVVRRLQDEGMDYFHVGNGSFEAMGWLLPDRDGAMTEYAAGFRKLLRVPVLTPAIHDPEAAERAVSEGWTDVVSLGRQLFADPEWARKVESGRTSEILRCSRCNTCYARLFSGLRVRCVLNPECGLEKYNPEYTRWAAMRGQPGKNA